MLLPPLPRLEVATRPAESGDAPYLTLEQRRVEVAIDGQRAEGTYTAVSRKAIDAAIIIATYMHSGAPFVYLRSCLRPPLVFRRVGDVLWELPAGLVERNESPVAAATRELHEELGFVVAKEAMKQLGPPIFPAAGLIAEVQTFFMVTVDPKTRVPPPEDGSPFELGGAVIEVSLKDALAACESGEIADAKTEIGLRRLERALA
jgi:ADP-ribose pyrophosphatase